MAGCSGSGCIVGGIPRTEAAGIRSKDPRIGRLMQRNEDALGIIQLRGQGAFCARSRIGCGRLTGDGAAYGTAMIEAAFEPVGTSAGVVEVQLRVPRMSGASDSALLRRTYRGGMSVGWGSSFCSLRCCTNTTAMKNSGRAMNKPSARSTETKTSPAVIG